MKLEPQRSIRSASRVSGFDAIFTTNKPINFAFHGYPWLIHRLAYRRTNHANLHVRGYKEEGAITTPFDMAVFNDLDRFHLVEDVINRLHRSDEPARALKLQMQRSLAEHRRYIVEYGIDMPAIRDWAWAS